MNDHLNQSGYPPFPAGGMGGTPPTVTAAKTKKGRRRKDPSGSGKRSSTGTGVLFLVFAAAMGLVAILITQAPENVTYVVRARSTIAALSEVTSEQFEVVGIDPGAVEPGTFSGETSDEVQASFDAAVDGKWFVYPVNAGQQIRPTMLAASGELERPLSEDERLISITVRAADAVSGTIRAGSTVDVYVSDVDGLTGVLGQGVEIVAVSLLPEQFESVAKQQFDDPDKTLSDFVAGQPVGGTYVIRVDASDVAKYIAANAAGTITLSLHGTDAKAFTAAPADIIQTICGSDSDEPACVRAQGE